MNRLRKLFVILLVFAVSGGCSREQKLLGRVDEPVLKEIADVSYVNLSYDTMTDKDLGNIITLNFSHSTNHPRDKYGYIRNKAYDFSILHKMDNLKFLKADFGDSIKSYKTLNGLATLEHLELTNVSESDLMELNDLKQVKYLQINDSSVKSLDFLKNFPKLEILNFSNSGLENFSGLRYVENLNRLEFQNCSLEDMKIDTFPSVGSLETLYIENSNFFSLDNLQAFPNLKELDIIKNSYMELGFLKNFPKVELLRINDTLLGSLDKLSFIPEVKYLDFTNCGLRDSSLSSIPPLENLERLNLGNNKITEINVPIFNNIKNLKSLVLNYNPLKSLNIGNDSVPNLNTVEVIETDIQNNDAVINRK